MSQNHNIYRNLGVGVACALGLAAASATAQPAEPPDPFADYEGWNSGEAPPPLPPAEESPTADAPKPAQAEDPSTLLPIQKGKWSLGGRALFSYTGTKNELLSGGDETNNTRFIRATPAAGYFILDQLQIGASFGLLSRSLARENGGEASETDWVLEATAHYYLPLSKRFALVPGAGLGFYLGSSDQTLRVLEGGELRDTTETTSTSGLLAGVYLGAAYQVSGSAQLRSGLALNALIGSERIDSKDQSLSASAVHIGLPIELFYTFD